MCLARLPKYSNVCCFWNEFNKIKSVKTNFIIVPNRAYACVTSHAAVMESLWTLFVNHGSARREKRWERLPDLQHMSRSLRESKTTVMWTYFLSPVLERPYHANGNWSSGRRVQLSKRPFSCEATQSRSPSQAMGRCIPHGHISHQSCESCSLAWRRRNTARRFRFC